LYEKEGTIKSRLSRGRRILAGEMKKGGTEDEPE
jgi:DNA-directed RNA polymerase specialized sigma24 family protein